VRFLQTVFEPDDWVAVFLKSYVDGRVVQRVASAGAEHYASDCPMAAQQIESGLERPKPPEHPLRLLRIAYGL